MATLFAVVSEAPAPMQRAGALEPVIRTLLEKDPARRGTVGELRSRLEAVAAGTAPPPPPPAAGPPPAPPPPPPAGALHEGSIQRFDAEDLRRLASASKAVLGAVARDVVDRRRDRRRGPRGRAPAPFAAAPPRRRRFKRRWIVVPVVTVVLLVALLLVGAGLAVAWWLGFI